MPTKCVCCLGYKGNILPFDQNLWAEVTVAAKDWLRYKRPPKLLKITNNNKILWDICLVDNLDDCYGYHNKCRTNFVSKSKLNAARARYETEQLKESNTDSESDDIDVSGPSPVKTRKVTDTSIKESSHGVLEAKCIICEKSGKRRYRKATKLVVEELSRCETKEAGLYNLFSKL